MLGLLGALLAVAVPFLPVVQETAEISWPQGGDTAAVNSPLAAFQAQEITATIPCAAAASLDARSSNPAPLLSTVPPAAPVGNAVGMVALVADGNLTVSSRGQVLGGILLPPGPCDITLRSTVDVTTASVGDRQFIEMQGDVRPQITGIYTDLDETLDPVDGLGVQITPDTRFQSTAHVVKIAAVLLALAAVIAALILLYRLDVRVGRRAPRWLPPRWWRPTGRDAVVIAVLAVWVVIGGITSDDGYILTMIQARADIGYIGNYYRWFNVPEAPFGWPYELYAVWAQLSTSPPWLRLPSFGMGVISWLLISREVLPRLGREVRRSRAAGWAAASVFLAFWLPYNNGLRLEPVVAIGSLLALCAVERAVATRRVTPIAVGLLAVAFTVTATPTGLIAVAPFLVGARPLLRLLRRHADASGWGSVLAPIVGSGLLVLAVIFVDQTWAGVLEAIRLRTTLGPSLSWYEEPTRYQALFTPSPDGALPRRFPVLVFLLCLGACGAVALRRGGIPGAGLHPGRRLIGTAALSLALIALTPTKWTHHFGSFASVAAALGALTALATSASVLRSARNRWWFLSGLFVVLALAATGPNAPWYVSHFGVPWFDKPPSFRGYQASTALIALAAISAAVAVVLNLRSEPGAPPAPADRRRKALALASTPLSLICGLLVFAEVGAMAKAIHKQRNSYSLGAANFEHIFDSSCNLSEAVAMEQNRLAGALAPVPSIEADDIPLRRGFVRDSPPPPQTAPGASSEGGADGATDERRDAEEQSGNNQESIEDDRTDAGDTDRESLAGSPPTGLGGDQLPVWSSYETAGTGDIRIAWYELPEAARQGNAPVVMSVAGTLGPATPITAQLGGRTPGGGVEPIAEVPVEGEGTDATPGWRDYRLNVSGFGADSVRLLASDIDVTSEGWLAFSAPRVPKLEQMTDIVGRTTPVFMDWPVGFVFPCLRPYSVVNGIVELPEYRLLPDEELLVGSENWSTGEAGGPLGWLEIVSTERELPTYLRGAWTTDWGQLDVIEPRVSDTQPPEITTSTEVRSGLWSPGPMRGAEEGTEISPLTR
ncbi:MAG: arabinosyltransferase domain-containing protein [Actinomycetota bacterium]|nr:arabinosyltransferase domain-containing protein [Actinomycetota bacterium]